jgi:hypothetical protein
MIIIIISIIHYLLCTVPPSVNYSLQSPASVLLCKMPWNKKFPVNEIPTLMIFFLTVLH